LSPARHDTLPVCVDCLAAEIDVEVALALAWQRDQHGWRCPACAGLTVRAARSSQPDGEWSWPNVSSGVHAVLRSGERTIDPDPRERPTVPVPDDEASDVDTK
jgi:hypothetical protein